MKKPLSIYTIVAEIVDKKQMIRIQNAETFCFKRFVIVFQVDSEGITAVENPLTIM